MINFLLRPLIALSGVITGLFIATDTLRFTVVQAVVGILLSVGLMAIAAFWPESWTRKFTGRGGAES